MPDRKGVQNLSLTLKTDLLNWGKLGGGGDLD